MTDVPITETIKNTIEDILDLTPDSGADIGDTGSVKGASGGGGGRGGSSGGRGGSSGGSRGSSGGSSRGSSTGRSSGTSSASRSSSSRTASGARSTGARTSSRAAQADAREVRSSRVYKESVNARTWKGGNPVVYRTGYRDRYPLFDNSFLFWMIYFSSINNSAELSRLRTENKELIQTMEHGNLLNARNGYGETAVIIAAREGDIKALTFMKENGADFTVVDNDGKNAFLWAAQEGQLEAMKFLYAINPDLAKAVDFEGNNALHLAAANGQAAMIPYLVQTLGLDVNAPNKADQTPAMLAARVGDVFSLRVMHKLGANFDALSVKGNNALMTAAVAGEVDATKFLLTVTKDVNQRNNDNRSALAMVLDEMRRTADPELEKRYQIIAEKLIEAGARLGAQDKEMKLLRGSWDRDFTLLLLKAGAKPYPEPDFGGDWAKEKRALINAANNIEERLTELNRQESWIKALDLDKNGHIELAEVLVRLDGRVTPETLNDDGMITLSELTQAMNKPKVKPQKTH